jgi:hypothetical protein
MRTILRALYKDRIYPAEQIIPEDPGYQFSNRKISGEIEKWERKLSKDDFEQLKTLTNLYRRVGSMEACASYVHGFRLGAMMMMEVLGGKEEIAGSDF